MTKVTFFYESHYLFETEMDQIPQANGLDGGETFLWIDGERYEVATIDYHFAPTSVGQKLKHVNIELIQ